MAAADGRELPVVTDAERAVADLLPIERRPGRPRASAASASRCGFTRSRSTASTGSTRPGVARDHRYRVPFLPPSFAGQRVLDVGTFDGFYAFLAEHRGAARVVAVDNEQYVAWVQGALGRSSCRAARASARSPSCWARACEYRARRRARRSTSPAERFDVVLLLRDPAPRREPARPAARARRRCWRRAGGCWWRPTGVASDGRLDARTIEVQRPGDVYAGDEYVYWGFGAGGLRALATLAGFARVDDRRQRRSIDGHPRIIATLTRAS